jgi:peptide/nickel transport system substrate-binding protein
VFRNKKLVCFVVLMLSVALIMTGCSGTSSTPASGEKAQDGILIIARSTDAELIDPGFGWSEGDIDIIYHLYDGLVKFKNDDLEVEPALATEWKVSEDGKTWTFKLREGVKFHDGTDFNAEAVVQTFKRILDENNKYYGVVQGGYSYLEYLMADVVEDVVAVDEYTVDFKLNQVFAPFLTYMGYYSQFIVSPTALDEYGAKFPQNPVGTGPFVFDKWQRGEYVQLKVNENYWGEKPIIDTLIFKCVPESSTRLMELQSGQVDVIKALDPGQLSKVEADENLELLSVPGANLFYAAFNCTKEPFNNQKVRQAINHAIDMDKIVEVIYEGSGTRAINSLPPTVFSFDETAGPYEYNPQKAKELLAEAGYPNGFETNLYSFIYARPYVAKPVQVAEVIKADLEAVGVKVNIVTNEWATHSDIMDNMKHDIGLSGWYDIPYPSNFLKAMALEGANTGYMPDELVELAKAAWATYDRAEQEEIYKEFQHKLYEGAPLIPIAHNNYTAAISKNVKGFELDIIGTVRAHKAYKE